MTSSSQTQITPYEKEFITIAKTSFNIIPFKWQYSIGGLMIESIKKKRVSNILCVRPTGGGKSLLYQVIAYYLKKITLFISPILVLGADQMRKILNIPDESIAAFHLDELSDKNLSNLEDFIKILHPKNTVILLASPQFLKIRGKSFLKFLQDKKLSKWLLSTSYIYVFIMDAPFVTNFVN